MRIGRLPVNRAALSAAHRTAAAAPSEIDAHMKRYAVARDELRAYIDSRAPQQDEAQYYYIGTLRELGQRDEYIREARAFASSNGDSAFSEEALNDLATYFVLQSDDANAGDVC